MFDNRFCNFFITLATNLLYLEEPLKEYGFIHLVFIKFLKMKQKTY